MIFDTDVIIFAGKNKAFAEQAIMKAKERRITVATYMEFVPYCRDRLELNKFTKMLTHLRFSILPITESSSNLAKDLVLNYALSHSMRMGDALNAAIAIDTGETLCTCNAKDFKYIPNLLLQPLKVASRN
ncbi:MAG: PIN domain-containing protein [Pseudomonadales bacterium]